jgi:hypothetical protein
MVELNEVRRDALLLEYISKAVGKVSRTCVSIRIPRDTEFQCGLKNLMASSRSDRGRQKPSCSNLL